MSAPAPAPSAAAPIDTLRLISSDGFTFIIDRKLALRSNTIKNMLSSPGQFTESIQNEVVFPDIKAIVLEKLCLYFHYAARFQANPDAPDFYIDPELSMELLMAADYLDT